MAPRVDLNILLPSPHSSSICLHLGRVLGFITDPWGIAGILIRSHQDSHVYHAIYLPDNGILRGGNIPGFIPSILRMTGAVQELCM